jgi:hypothetical protein
MKRTYLFVTAAFAALGVFAAIGSIASADPAKDARQPAKKAAAAKAAADKPGADKPEAQPEFKLPAGWTPEDMKAFLEAATPGKMHERLAQDVGVWEGKNTLWMAPDADPVETESTCTITPLFDGRFVKCEMKGEMPGMGPYNGLMISGYDNITKKFVTTWVDNVSTSMAQGEGELSKDGKTLTWNFTCNCPLTQKPVSMRQVETVTGPGTKTLEMFGTEPKSGQEYKMMRIELTKSASTGAPAARTGR